LIAGESVTFANDTFVLRDARLRSTPGNGLPIYVACSGPKMMDMAGECADGVIMLAGATPSTVESALTHVQAGVQRAGRSLSDLDIAWGAATVISDDRAGALAQTRVMAAWYANYSAGYARAAGASATAIAAMQGKNPGTNLHEAREAAELAPDNVVDSLTLAGNPAHVRNRIGEVRDMGVDHFELFLIGPQKEQTLRRFADSVIPSFR